MLSPKLKLLALFLTLSVAVLVLAKNSSAEIATTRDWIGLFSTDPTKVCDSTDTVTTCRGKTVGGNSWGYPSNKSGNTCLQTPGAVPVLSDASGCYFTVPPTGSYEIRMYAYDGTSAEALIASSPLVIAAASPPPGGGGGTTGCPAQSTNPRVFEGLISAPNVSNNYGNPSAICVVGNQASFVPFKIPTHDDLKSLYFDQTILTSGNLFTVSGPAIQSGGKSPIDLSPSATPAPIPGKLYHVTGDLTINSNITPLAETGMVFVEGVLNINTNLTHADENAGLVLLSKGDIVIAPSVTRIDAVLIAGGKIYTAGADCIKNTVTESSPGAPIQQLKIYGSLITLDSNNNIQFCRSLANNNTPAETITQQPKYLVILRNILSTTLQKWTEIQ